MQPISNKTGSSLEKINLSKTEDKDELNGLSSFNELIFRSSGKSEILEDSSEKSRSEHSNYIFKASRSSAKTKRSPFTLLSFGEAKDDHLSNSMSPKESSSSSHLSESPLSHNPLEKFSLPSRLEITPSRESRARLETDSLQLDGSSSRRTRIRKTSSSPRLKLSMSSKKPSEGLHANASPLDLKDKSVKVKPREFMSLMSSDELVELAVAKSLSGNMNDYDLLTDKRAINEFNKKLRNQLLILVDHLKNKDYFITAREGIHQYSIEKVCDFFKNLDFNLENFPINDLTSKVTDDIINSPVFMLKSVFDNLEFIRAEIWGFSNIARVRTHWSKELYDTIVKLILASNMDQLINLIKNFEPIDKNSLNDANLQDLNFIIKYVVLACFGRFNDEVRSNINMVYKWNSQTDLHILHGEIFAMLASTAFLAIKARHITSHRHLLQQSIPANIEHLHIESLAKIPIESIIRSIKPESNVLFDKIVINNVVFHESAGRETQVITPPLARRVTDTTQTESFEIKEKSTQKFFIKLFRAIYNINAKDHTNYKKIKKEVKLFLNLFKASEDGNNFGTSKSLFDYKFKDDIPLIGILRLMTIDCSLTSTNYLRLLFPRMFSRSFGETKVNYYDLKYVQGIQCEINIDDNGFYEVIQKKKAVIVKTDQRDTELAKLDIHWSVHPTDTGHEGALKIASWKVLDSAHWEPLVQIWNHPQDVSKSPCTPFGWTFIPDLS